MEQVVAPAWESAAAELAASAGFRATVFAGDDLVHNAYCLTTDDAGRVAVSGPGYIQLLIDGDGDGRAEEVAPFADGPASGAQGLCFDGDDLLAVGDDGLVRYRDADWNGRADGPPVTLLKVTAGDEHHAHAIRRGPDGRWYLICGNDTGITAADITGPNSPVPDPEAGVLLRFRYDRAWDEVRDVEVFAHGMRNAYGFDFSAAGDPVTFDSDDEREVTLPWYRPTRVFRLTPGSHAGWVSRSWKRPDADPEMPEVLARLGRGSPTGVAVYRHTRVARSESDYRWTPEAVELLGESDDPAGRERLRALCDDPALRGSALRGSALRALAERPDASDRGRFLAGLDEPQIKVVERCVAALERLGPSSEPAALAALVEALRRLDRDPREYAVRSRVAELLRSSTGEDFGFVFGNAGHRPQPDAIGRWVEFARAAAPESAASSAGDWEARRPAVAEAAALVGDPERGGGRSPRRSPATIVTTAARSAPTWRGSPRGSPARTCSSRSPTRTGTSPRVTAASWSRRPTGW